MKTSRYVASFLLAGAIATVLAAGIVAGGRTGIEAREVALPSDAELVQLREKALKVAANHHDGTPDSALVGAGTRNFMVGQLMGSQVSTDQDVYVVQMRGNFISPYFSYRFGGGVARGTHLTLVYDAETLVLHDASLGMGNPRALASFENTRELLPSVASPPPSPH